MKKIRFVKKSKSGLKRNPIDKFYTKPDTVKLCSQTIFKSIYIDPNDDLVIEPSAGDGAFIEAITKITQNYLFYDIKPEHNLIKEKDYLKMDYTQLNYQNIHIIGNPPFGRQSCMAIKFIKYSAQFCSTISFILPKSFKKESMKARVPLQFHLINEIDLPINSFTLNNNEHDVPCIFQVWAKKTDKRILPEKIKPTNYTFVEKTDVHDISFRRVGINAGTISTQTKNNSIQSHYFIKINNFTPELFDKLSKLHFKSSMDTVGPKSISKPELIREYNRLIL